MNPLTSFFIEQNDKPGYVVDDHLSRPAVTSRFKQPTRKARRAAVLLHYLVLLRMGFTWLRLLPDAR